VEGALEEIRRLPAVRQAGAQVSLYDYSRPSYTGLVYPTECYFPCWVIEERHPACQALVASYQSLFAKKPVVDKWTFSTTAYPSWVGMAFPVWASARARGPGARAQ